MKNAGILFAVLVVCAAVVGCAPPEGEQHVYKCTDGTQVKIFLSEDGKKATMRLEGRTYKLSRDPSESGTKYSGDRAEFWIEENSGFVKIDGEVVHDGCELVE